MPNTDRTTYISELVLTQVDVHINAVSSMLPDASARITARRLYTKATLAFLESSLLKDERSSTYEDSKIIDLWGAFVEGWAARADGELEL